MSGRTIIIRGRIAYSKKFIKTTAPKYGFELLEYELKGERAYYILRKAKK